MEFIVSLNCVFDVIAHSFPALASSPTQGDAVVRLKTVGVDWVYVFSAVVLQCLSVRLPLQVGVGASTYWSLGSG